MFSLLLIRVTTRNIRTVFLDAENTFQNVDRITTDEQIKHILDSLSYFFQILSVLFFTSCFFSERKILQNKLLTNERLQAGKKQFNVFTI